MKQLNGWIDMFNENRYVAFLGNLVNLVGFWSLIAGMFYITFKVVNFTITIDVAIIVALLALVFSIAMTILISLLLRIMYQTRKQAENNLLLIGFDNLSNTFDKYLSTFLTEDNIKEAYSTKEIQILNEYGRIDKMLHPNLYNEHNRSN
jgi:hypothetical protein